MTRATTFPANDHRNFNRDGQRFNVGETFAGLEYGKGIDLVDGLRPLVPAGLTMGEMALRWCLDFDAVSAIIPGARNAEQAQANARAFALPSLSPELHATIADYYQREVAAQIRGPY